MLVVKFTLTVHKEILLFIMVKLIKGDSNDVLLLENNLFQVNSNLKNFLIIK